VVLNGVVGEAEFFHDLAGSVVDVCLNDSGLVGVWRIARGSALAILRGLSRSCGKKPAGGIFSRPLVNAPVLSRRLWSFYEKTQNTSDD